MLLLGWFSYNSLPAEESETPVGFIQFSLCEFGSSNSQPPLHSAMEKPINKQHFKHSPVPTCSSTVIQPRARRVSLSTAPCLGGIPYVAVSIRFEVSRLSGTKGLVPWQDSRSPSPFETAYNSLSSKGSPRSSYKNIPAQPVIIKVQEQQHMTSFSN